MGAPYFKFRDQLESMGAVVVSSNYTLYGDMSSRVMDVLGEFTPDLEIYSIDEAWLDLTGFDPATLDAYGRHVVEVTTQNTGIPVSMGIATTKVLAKIANRICKKRVIPGGVFNLGGAGSMDPVLATLPVGDLWGIGRRWAEKLKSHGIHTALDLKNADPAEIRDRYSVVMERLLLELRGIPCLGFEDIQPKKQIIASRSFGKKVTSLHHLLEAAASHATRAGEKLRRQDSACGSLQVAIRTSKFKPEEPYYAKSARISFLTPTSDSRLLVRATRQGITKIFQEGRRYAKVEVMLTNICPTTSIQRSLFTQPDDARSIRLMATMDQINARLGRHTVHLGAEGFSKPWAMKRDQMTKAYTTRWTELPEV